MKQTILLSGLCAALLCGCADVAFPEYQRPEYVKSSWSNPRSPPCPLPARFHPQWWTEFRDPYLDSLVAKAIAGNFDLKILAEHLRGQPADRRGRRGRAADGGHRRRRQPGKSTGQRFSKQFSAGAQLNWEIDVWGRVSKSVGRRPPSSRRPRRTGAPAT